MPTATLATRRRRSRHGHPRQRLGLARRVRERQARPLGPDEHVVGNQMMAAGAAHPETDQVSSILICSGDLRARWPPRDPRPSAARRLRPTPAPLADVERDRLGHPVADAVAVDTIRLQGLSWLVSFGRSRAFSSGERKSVTTVAGWMSVSKTSWTPNVTRSATPARAAFAWASRMRWGRGLRPRRAPRIPWRP